MWAFLLHSKSQCLHSAGKMRYGISCLSSREGGSLEFNMEATLSLWQHRELGWKQGPDQGQMEQNSEVDPLKGNLEQEYADR